MAHGSCCEFKFQGTKELEDALRDLHKDVAKRILWNAAMHGAEIIRRAIGQNILSQGLIEEGTLLANVAKHREKMDDPMKAAYRIGIKSPKPAYWDYFLELGTVKMPAKPFIHPAVESSKNEAQEKIKAVLRRRIATEVRRVARLSKRSYL